MSRSGKRTVGLSSDDTEWWAFLTKESVYQGKYGGRKSYRSGNYSMRRPPEWGAHRNVEHRDPHRERCLKEERGSRGESP